MVDGTHGEANYNRTLLTYRRVRHGRGHGVPLLPGGLGAQRRQPGAALLHEQGTPGGHQEDAEVQRWEGLMGHSYNCQKIVVPVLASPSWDS